MESARRLMMLTQDGVSEKVSSILTWEHLVIAGCIILFTFIYVVWLNGRGPRV